MIAMGIKPVVGYIGYGVVGQSCHSVFMHNTNSIIIDPKHTNHDVKELVRYNAAVTFISLPAPTMDNGRVDDSLILQYLESLANASYTGIVVVKSTLTPDIVRDLFQVYQGHLRLIFSPEFITESSKELDATYPSMIILSGEYMTCVELRTFYEHHSVVDRPGQRVKIADYVDAAMVKYTINTFLALKVAFFNQIHEVFTRENGQPLHQEDWAAFINLVSTDPRIGTSHMNVPGPDLQYGYGGRCFPKDVKAFIEYGSGKLSILEEADLYNLKRRLGDDSESL